MHFYDTQLECDYVLQGFFVVGQSK